MKNRYKNINAMKFLLIQKIICVYGHAIWYGSSCDLVGIRLNSN